MLRLESLKQLIATARGNKYSILKKLVSNDDVVFSVWDMVSQWVEFNMQRQKAVNIAGLGCFTFTSKELDIGYKRYIVVHKPVFILSEKLVNIHRLNQPKHLVPGEIPVTQLNLIALANELNMHRDVVEASVKEIINAFSRQIEKKGEAELCFTTIGNLVINCNQAKMKFLSSFLESMDKTGSLVKYFANRPDTSDSVIENDGDRPPTVLPKIEPGGDLELARNEERNCVAYEDGNGILAADDRVASTPKSERSTRKDRSEKSLGCGI
jgi:nucleoid DNA-binding protein